MLAAARIAIPVILPRAFLVWATVRFCSAAAPLAAGADFGSVPPSPLGIVAVCGVVGLVDVSIRGERILWANLGMSPKELFAVYAAAAIPAEWLLALIAR